MGNATTMADARVYVHSGVVNRPSVLSALRTWGGCWESYIAMADTFVVPDVMNPGQRASWAVALNGGRVVGRTFVQTKGRAVVAIKFIPAIYTKRKVWLSLAFVRAHKELTSVAVATFSKPACEWTLLATEAEFLASVSAARPLDTIALVMNAQQTSAALVAVTKTCMCCYGVLNSCCTHRSPFELHKGVVGGTLNRRCYTTWLRVAKQGCLAKSCWENAILRHRLLASEPVPMPA